MDPSLISSIPEEVSSDWDPTSYIQYYLCVSQLIIALATHFHIGGHYLDGLESGLCGDPNLLISDFKIYVRY